MRRVRIPAVGTILGLPTDVRAVMAITVAASFGNAAIATLFTPLGQEFEISAAPLSALVAGYAIARLAVDLPAGALIDRVRALPLFYVGGALAITGVVVSVLAPVYGLVLAGRIVEGMGASTAGAAAQAYVARRAPERERGRILGAVSAATMSGAFLAPAFVGLVASLAGWRAGLLITVLPVLGGMALVKRYVTTEPPRPRGAAASHDLRHAFYSPGSLALVNLMSIALAVPIFGFKALFYPDVGRALQLEPWLIGIALSLSALMRFPIAIVAGALSDRFGRLPVYVPSAILAGVVSVVVSQANGPLTYVVFGLAFGLGGGSVPMVTSMVVDRTPPGRMGAALGTHAFLRDIGVALTPLGLGLGIEAMGHSTAAFLLLGSAAFSALLAMLAGESAPARRARAPTS